MTSQAIESVAGELGSNVFYDWSPTLGGFLRGQWKGLATGGEIEAFVGRHVSVREMAHLPIQFAVVAADLNTGDTIRINGGSLEKAVRASAGVPVMMEPVSAVVDGRRRELVDGGLVEPIAIRTARLLGATIVVAVDVGYRPSEARLSNPLDVSFQTIQIAIHSLRSTQLLDADFVITPHIHERNVSDGGISQLINEGQMASRDVIRALIERQVNDH